MMNIPLNRISVYMPHRLSDQELEAGFIVRNEVFENIAGKLKEETATSIPQHYLIVGQRGMGKTTLLLRVALEIRKNDRYNHLIPLSFPEEQYNIDRLSKFWLNCLDALADTLETENNKKLADEIDETVKNLSKEVDEKEIAEKAFEAFKLMAKKTKRRPVLLIDNLNQLLDSLQQNEQWELRNRITKPGSPILVGASAEPLKENYTYDAPFYDSFEVFLLERLRFEETIFLLQSLAARTGEKELLKRLHTETARLKTLYTLTGGNPRTVVILFQVFAKGFSDTVYEDLDTLLEAVTPIYKARFEELSQQLQVVVDAIALHWDPCRLEDLRELTRLTNSVLSAQLKRLKEIGWVSQMEAFSGRGAAYEISERFFNVWYLMRRSSRRQRRDLLCLTRFLESLYAEDIDKVAEFYLKDPVKDVHHVTYGLALANATKRQSLKIKVRNKAFDNLMSQEISSDIIKAFKMPQGYKNEKEIELNNELSAALAEERIHEAFEIIKKWKKINKNNARIWMGEGYMNSVFFKKYKQAKDDYLKAIKLNKKEKIAWHNLAKLLHEQFNEYKESEVAYVEALKLDSRYGHSWNGLGILLHDLGRYEEAEIAYRNAIRSNSKSATYWNNLANLLQFKLNRFKEAEDAYLLAISLDEKDPLPLNGLACLYQDHYQNYLKAEEKFLKAIQLDEKYLKAWINLGILFRYDLGRCEDAVDCFRRAISIDEKHIKSWIYLGEVLYYDLRLYKEAEEVYRKAIELDSVNAALWNDLGNVLLYLKRYQDSETALKRAIELDESNAHFWCDLGDSLMYLERYQDAEVAFQRAINLDEHDPYFWNSLGDSLMLMRRYQESEIKYRKAIELDENNAYFWSDLGNLLIYLERYDESDVAYRKAVELDAENVYILVDYAILLHFYLKKYEEAEIVYQKILELDKENIIAWNGLGQLLYVDLKQYERAELAYRKAIQFEPDSVDTWNEFGQLLHYELGKYEEAEFAYNKVIELDENHMHVWNHLGNLLLDHLHQYLRAKQCFEKAIKINCENIPPKFNLLSLIRDKLKKVEAAKKYWKEICEPLPESRDIYFLTESLFAFYDKNLGVAIDFLKQALVVIGDSFPSATSDDWQRTAAITVKLGYGENLLQLLKETGHDVILRPFYEAIQALTLGTENYLNSIAAEIREPARQIYQYMNNYAYK